MGLMAGKGLVRCLITNQLLVTTLLPAIEGNPSNHQGDWWIGGYENRSSKAAEAGAIQGDSPKGTLTSPPFRIIGRKISFLIGGGCDMTVVHAELLVDNEVRGYSTVSRPF